MEKVTGIGGFFFRAANPAALRVWYEKNLGITPAPTADGGQTWETEAGTTVFEPFPKDTDYFRDPKNQWMINFRVKNLDAMAKQLQDAGVAIAVEASPYGKFGKLVDPEGNPIELWESA